MNREGDIVGGRFRLGEHVAYQGDPDCTDRSHGHRYVGGEMLPGCITGYHCPRCGEGCGMTGHKCACLCGAEGPDEFGNYDQLEHPECPIHGAV